MEDEEADSYTDLNRAFLQAFIARSTLTYEEAKPVIASIISAQRRSRQYAMLACCVDEGADTRD